MPTLAKRTWLRIAVTVRQSWPAIVFIVAWLVANALVFATRLQLSPSDAVLAALCIRKTEGAWGRFYASFTEFVVFGAVASMLVTNATRRYRPEATCAALAERASGHLLVVGYTNLGKRMRDMAIAAGAEVVVVEEDRALVDELVRAEDALVIGNAREPSVLAAARVERAKVVVLAGDDLEAIAVACRVVRERNPRCTLVVRCSDDDVGQILAKAYQARVLSTSRIAARFIVSQAQRAGVRRAVVMGKNSVGRRVAEALAAQQVACELVAETEDPAALAQAGVGSAELVVMADDDLGKNLVRVDRVRDLAPEAMVICRVFHDDAAEILTQRPFRCVVLSTSRLAAEVLADEGILRGVGVAKAPSRRAARTRAGAQAATA